MDSYPEKTKRDKAIDATHVGIQLIPLGGGISEFVKAFYPSGFEVRKEAWLKCLADKVDAMPEGVSQQLITYFSEEEGKSLLLKATISAILTHKIEKHLALRNVLLNTASNPDIHYDKKEIYVGIVGDLENYDISLLMIFNTNDSAFGEVDSYEDVFEICKNCGFRGDRDEFTLIMNKLKDKSLIRVSEYIDGFNDVYSANSRITSATTDMPKILVTDLAKSLISYIEETP